ncbi:hypothetical protein BKK49_09035 [Rodentibacter rarus]|uniref:hypothetical protein n=1 Tax=Rodentibacter rarus TaxID=1908260 RepID=UPI00098706E7|nr:hypothetical protein [Rodentibacter rarus]OOF38837.1 hypothetical protein BKK49_09035 [Rodentibacter rarus]
MYFSENKSAIEQWCEQNRIPLSQAKNGEDILHELNLSKFPVERAFNGLTVEQREMLKAASDIEPIEDYISPDLSGDKLCHYNTKGLDKLSKGLKAIAGIRAAFPKALSLSDFFLIDPQTRGQQ